MLCNNSAIYNSSHLLKVTKRSAFFSIGIGSFLFSSSFSQDTLFRDERFAPTQARDIQISNSGIKFISHYGTLLD